MKEYTLFLDESGNFKEQGRLPSIVSGYLVEGKLDNDQWAKNILLKTQKSSSEYAGIDIDKFHGMNDYSETIQHFCYDLVSEIINKEASIIVFKNKHRQKVLNSDITYLNVFSTGIAKLLENLSVKDNDSVKLNVFFAQRKNIEYMENGFDRIRIGMDNYTVRIDEHIALKLAQLPDHLKRNNSYSLKMGVATKEPLLMLADAVNYLLRGCYTNYNKDMRDKVRSLPVTQFDVLFSDRWSYVCNQLNEGNLATAIFCWYSECDKLETYSEEFHALYSAIVSKSSATVLQLQYDLLSIYIKNIINLRKFDLATILLDRLLGEFVSLLPNRKINVDRVTFDLLFFKLTVATHTGDTAEEERCISNCDIILPKLGINFETLDYYLTYKLRVVEHYKNVFEFEKAISILDKMEELQKNLLSLLELAGDFSGLGDNIKSSNLGKIYGSRLAARTFLFNERPEQIELARNDSDEAINQFVDLGDKLRQYQYRSMVEYKCGCLSESLAWLAKAVEINEDMGPQEILEKIVDAKQGREFLLMHYSNIMYRALEKGTTLGKGMYKAWKTLGIDELLGKKFVTKNSECAAKYPYYVIYWNSAKANELSGESGKNNFRIAESGAMLEPNNLTIYFAGIAIMMDRYANTFTKIGSADINKLIDKVKAIDEIGIPEKMLELRMNLLEELENLKLDNSDISKTKETLTKLVKRVPIL